MTSKIGTIDNFHNTRRGKLVFGFGELIAAWIIGVIAVDSGAIWQYILALVLFIGGVRNIANAFHHPASKNAKKRK